MSFNKKNQKAPALEDLKTCSANEKAETVDLIQENNLDRFEKKKQKFKPRNTGNKPPQNNNRDQNAVKDKPEPNNTQKPQKKFNKPKKKFPPKKND